MSEESMANPESREPSQSFREQTEARLQRERNGQPENQDDTSPGSEVDEEPRETEEADAEESEVETEDQPEAEADNEAVDNEDGEPDPEWTAERQQLIEQADKAEEARKSMETDYRRKTHKLSQATREVESQAEEVQATATYYAQMAEAKLQQFQSVNWQQLQTDPAQYQQAQQAFMQAQQEAQQRKNELEQIGKRAKEMRAKQSEAVAEHSRGVLMHQIPNWGGEVYSELREFAEKEYDYTQDEFDAITDWRPMKMLYDAKQAAKVRQEASKVVKKVGRKSGRKAPGKTAAGQPRNAQGQFKAAREAAFANPGDRSAFREFQNRRLEQERNRRR